MRFSGQMALGRTIFGSKRFTVLAIVFTAIVLVVLTLSCASAPSRAFADEGGEDSTEADFYAVLHPDGELEFQLEPSPIKSDYSYPGSLGGYGSAKKVPWLAKASEIISVSFAEEFKTLQPMSLVCWFAGCQEMRSINLTNLDASKSTSMEKMFMGCESLSDIEGLEQFDTSSSTYFGSMFRNCASLKSLDVSHFDASHVEVLCFMFNGCSSLETLNMAGEGWRTSSLNLMVHVWEGCSSLKSLDLSYLDTSGVRSMTYDFNGCTSLEYLDLSGVDSSGIGNLRCMFDGCTGLVTLKLGPRFTFNGSTGERQCALPTGNWKSSATGHVYAGDSIPNFAAATYIRVDDSDDDAPSKASDDNASQPDAGSWSQGHSSLGLAMGATAKVAGVTYRVTNNAKATVTFLKAPKSKKRVIVPASITLNGKKYAVTALAKNSFKGSKAKTVVVKTKKLVKKRVKGCFKGASKLKKVKAPKSKFKAYVGIFARVNSGQSVLVIS